MLRSKAPESHPEPEFRLKSSNLLLQAREGISTVRETVKYRNIWDTTAKIMQ
jgi:hypothetical protein